MEATVALADLAGLVQRIRVQLGVRRTFDSVRNHKMSWIRHDQPRQIVVEWYRIPDVGRIVPYVPAWFRFADMGRMGQMGQLG